MHVAFPQERRGPIAASAFFVAAIAMTGIVVVEDRSPQKVIPLLACAILVAMFIRQLTRWRTLLRSLLLVILFIPIKRYTLPGHLPFELEPYRIAVAFLTLAWIFSMLVDRRVRLRRSGFDVPLMAVLLTTLLSDVFNLSNVRPMSSDVLKAQTFFLSFFVVLYLVVSLVRTREDLISIVKFLAAGGTVIAAFGILERRTGYNVFNHLHSILPILAFQGGTDSLRGGRFRVLGPSQHPIALSVLFVVLLPLVIYLIRREGKRWLFAAALYVIAIFSTASRTGIIGVLILALVYLVLQPRAVLRAWPLALPLLAVIHVAAPGAIGTIRATMNPAGMLREQSAIQVGNDAYASGRLTDIGPTVSEWSKKPLMGVGFATRIISGPKANARLLDDQWLGTLLETGYFGVIAWVWLFARSIRRLGRAAASEGDTLDGWLLTGFVAAITAFAVTMWFYDTFSFIQNVFMCFILLGTSTAILHLREAETQLPADTHELVAA